MKAMIVAYDQQRGIGFKGDMPWHRDLPSDLVRFSQLTKGSAVIMGRTTYLTIGRPLKDRQNIVLSSQAIVQDGIEIARSVEEAFELARSKDVFVIGGGYVYAECLPLVDVIYATEVHHTFQADTFFPELDAAEWRIAEREDHAADERNKYDYSYVTYTRR